MLKVANPTHNDVLWDLGCGDGRVLIEAVKTYGCKAYGIEIDKNVAVYAQKRVREANVNATVYLGDATKSKIDGTIVTMYLYPDTMAKIVPRLRGCKIISYLHSIPGYTNQRIKINNNQYIYYVNLSWQNYLAID